MMATLSLFFPLLLALGTVEGIPVTQSLTALLGGGGGALGGLPLGGGGGGGLGGLPYLNKPASNYPAYSDSQHYGYPQIPYSGATANDLAELGQLQQALSYVQKTVPYEAQAMIQENGQYDNSNPTGGYGSDQVKQVNDYLQGGVSQVYNTAGPATGGLIPGGNPLGQLSGQTNHLFKLPTGQLLQCVQV